MRIKPEQIDEMYQQLTPENQQKVNELIEELAERQGAGNEDHN